MVCVHDDNTAPTKLSGNGEPRHFSLLISIIVASISPGNAAFFQYIQFGLLRLTVDLRGLSDAIEMLIAFDCRPSGSLGCY